MFFCFFLDQQVLSYPMISEDQLDALINVGDDGTHILQDSKDSNLFYIPPKRVEIAKNPLTKRSLFKIHIKENNESAELIAILKLTFDQERILDEWSRIKSQNPNAGLTFLPIRNGRFGLKLRSEEFTLLIGSGEIVQTEITSGKFPIHIKINRTGILVLQALSQIENTPMFTLDFSYDSLRVLPSERSHFNFNPKILIEELIKDPRIMQILNIHPELSGEEMNIFLIKSFAQNLWTAGGVLDSDFDLRFQSKIFRKLLNQYLVKIASSREFSFQNQYSDFNKILSFLPDENVALEFQNSSVQTIQDTASMVFANVCQNYQDAIFTLETGESQCFNLPIANPAPEGGSGDDDIWIPF